MPVRPDAGTDRLNHFDVIRLVAAWFVLVSHAYPIARGPDATQPLEGLFGVTLGAMSVWVFFALSGYLIARSFTNRRSLGSFAISRALRIYPALVINLVFVCAAGALVTTSPMQVYLPEAASHFVQNLLLFRIDYTLPGIFVENPYPEAVNGSLWTLFYEVIFYVLIAVAGLAGLLATPLRAAMILLVALVMAALAVQVDLPSRLEALSGLLVPFAAGAALSLSRAPPLPVLVLAWLAALALHPTAFAQTGLSVAVAVSAISLGHVKALPLPSLRRVGDISYGVYIYAFPCQQFVAWMGWSPDSPLLNIAIATPVVVILAALSWNFVERPALRLARSFKDAPRGEPVRT